MPTLDALRREIRQKGERVARGAAILVQTQLQQTSPVDTGQMKKKTTVRIKNVGDVITAEAVADTPYAEFPIRGTRPHIIRPKKGQFLAFLWPGAPANIRKLPDGRVLVRSVNHPGNQPDPYWDTAINRWGDYLRQMANRLR